MDDRAVIDEQIAYYRARAAEYDDWWLRRGEFDLGADFAGAWASDVDAARAWLRAAALGEDVLELAAGSGNWTAELLGLAGTVTAVDSSAAMLALNRAKNTATATRLTTIEADVFTWQPPRRYDTVFSSFWISHVPASRWSDFWALVERALAPGGRVQLGWRSEVRTTSFAFLHGTAWRDAAVG